MTTTRYGRRAPETADRAPNWRDTAACLGQAALFLPRRDTGPEYVASMVAAKKVCEHCPVQQACLDEAMATERADTENARAGVRGGLTPQERAARYSRQRRRVPEPPTLLDQYLRRTEPLHDGHVRWTVATKSVAFQDRQYTAAQLAWALGTRREPEGALRTTCGMAGCVAVEHLSDEAMRNSARRYRRWKAAA
ncbi:WhiB family transcriptional regulator [Streptomyces sp. NPDC085612]|uniref:WhiB family transcriptional regulator n=1 Tax=Streptomyces sp. NPDC085612 TaxID=3365732 RepID=UPI0037CF431D